MRRAALILGVVALAGLAFVLLRLDPGSPSSAAAPLEAEARPEETAPAEIVPAELVRSDAPRSEERTAAAEPVVADTKLEAPAASATSVDSGLPLAGTIVVVDEHGAEHRAEDGTFSFVLWSGQRGTWHKVEVKGGRWRTEVPREPAVESLGLTAVRLGDRAAVSGPGFESQFEWPADGWLDLTARWPIASLLHVRDRESGREIAPVFLVDGNSWPQSEFVHPGPAPNAKDLGPSPVQLPATDAPMFGMRTVHARSPGYAWGRIEIDEQRGGERILLLDRGGDLEIVPVGKVGDPGLKVRAYGSDYVPVFELPLRPDRTVVVESLAAGSYRVKAEIGDYWSEPLVLGEAKVDVVAGTRASVTLTLKDPGPRAAVPLEGTLVLPTEWELGAFTLEFELHGTPLGGGDGRFTLESGYMQREGAASSEWRWSKEDVQPGRYEVLLREVSFRAILEVGEAGLRDARVVVPPPCVVLVQCIDEDTGLDVPDANVSWVGALPKGVRGWSNEEAKWDESARRWRFRAPQGEVHVSVHGGRYARAGEKVQARPGTNDVIVRLGRPTGLRVVLRDGQTDIPWSSSGDRHPQLESAEGQESYSSWSTGGGKITLHKREPGLYTLKVPEIPGFEPVPPVQVRLEKGVEKEHVVELVRKP
jgi:hypothetical protein